MKHFVQISLKLAPQLNFARGSRRPAGHPLMQSVSWVLSGTLFSLLSTQTVPTEQLISNKCFTIIGWYPSPIISRPWSASQALSRSSQSWLSAQCCCLTGPLGYSVSTAQHHADPLLRKCKQTFIAMKKVWNFNIFYIVCFVNKTELPFKTESTSTQCRCVALSFWP